MGGEVVVRVDSELCVSSGRCVADLPDAFGFDADDLAAVLPGAGTTDRAQLLAVARNCPAQAITVVEP